jgi:hypothetical protein
MKKIGKKQFLVLTFLLIVGLILAVWKGTDVSSQSASKDKGIPQTQVEAQSSPSSQILSGNEDVKSVDVSWLFLLSNVPKSLNDSQHVSCFFTN